MLALPSEHVFCACCPAQIGRSPRGVLVRGRGLSSRRPGLRALLIGSALLTTQGSSAAGEAFRCHRQAPPAARIEEPLPKGAKASRCAAGRRCGYMSTTYALLNDCVGSRAPHTRSSSQRIRIRCCMRTAARQPAAFQRSAPSRGFGPGLVCSAASRISAANPRAQRPLCSFRCAMRPSA